jgi:MFS family permease
VPEAGLAIGPYALTRYRAPGLAVAALMAGCACWAAVALPDRPRPPPAHEASHGRRDAYGTLIRRRGASVLVVACVGGAMIAALDISFPIVAHEDFGANPTLIAALLACFACVGVVAMASSEWYRRGRDDRDLRVRVVRCGVATQMLGGFGGLLTFMLLGETRGTDDAALAAPALLAGAVVVAGVMSATTPNLQLLANAADMRSHAGFYSGIRAVALSLGRMLGGFVAGLLLDVNRSPSHWPTFAFVISATALGLGVIVCFPPRTAELPKRPPDAPPLDEPLLRGSDSTGVDVASEP